MKWTAKLPRVLRNPAVVILVLSIIFIVVSLYCTQRTRPFLSDDVSWQTTFMSWSPFNGHIAYMGGKDNFIINVPFLLIMEHFLGYTRTALFVEASVMASINFIMFFIAGLYFLKKCSIKKNYSALLPFLWLASFGYNFSELFLNTYWRNLELGFSFICFMLAAKLYYREFDPLKSWTGRIVTLLFSALLGVFIFGDPYFLYFTIVPVMALFIGLYMLRKVSRRQLAFVIGLVIVSLFFAKLTRVAAARVGLMVPSSGGTEFVAISSLFSGMALEFQAILDVFGADFFGMRVASLGSINSLLNFAVIAYLCYLFYLLKKQKIKVTVKNRALPLWLTFIGLLSVLVLVIYLLSGLEAYRYLAIMVFALVLALALFVPSIKKSQGRQALTLLLVLATAFNILTTVHEANIPKSDSANNTANIGNYRLVNAVKKLGLTKGYSNYWDGNINTYLSRGKIHVLPVVCYNGQTQPYDLLVDTSLFTEISSRTFYEIDPDVTPSPGTCNEQELIAQFGQPAKILHVFDKVVLVYNYDIYSVMAGQQPPSQ